MKNNRLSRAKGGMTFLIALVIGELIAGSLVGVIASIQSGGNIVKMQELLGTNLYLFLMLAIPQLTFLICTISVFGGVKPCIRAAGFALKNNDYGVTKPKIDMDILIIVLIALGCFFGLSIINDGFFAFLKLFGYTPVESNFPTIATLTDYIIGIFVICLLPAVGEELIFRGVVLNSLRMGGSDLRAILLSGLFFMLFHASPLQTIYQFTLGCIFAIIVIKTGNLFYTMLLHFLNNFLAISVSYFSVSGEFSISIVVQIIAICAVVGGVIYFISHTSKIPNAIHDMDINNNPIFGEQKDVLSISNKESYVTELKVKNDIRSAKIYYIVASVICVCLWVYGFSQGLSL